MPIPIYDDIRVPALRLLKNGGVIKLKDFELPLSKEFGLNDEELNARYENNDKKIFYDRVAWALSYLNMAELVEKPSRGYYKISQKGLEMLSSKTPDEINDYVIDRVQHRSQSRKGEVESTQKDIEELTPNEKIYSAFKDLKATTYDEIIDVILSKTPKEFEKLVVALLQKMGYGGEIKDSGEVTQYSNDNGIDGIIKEDILGFGRIYIQAKRYKRDNGVGEPALRDFYGALGATNSKKGVFITTSSFLQNAKNYVDRLNGVTIVLIDGEQLAKYIYEYSLGMQTEQVIEIKKLDSDFWDMMEDEIK